MKRYDIVAETVGIGVSLTKVGEREDGKYYLASDVDALLRLIACQDEGYGGNLRPEEIYRSMQRLAREALGL